MQPIADPLLNEAKFYSAKQGYVSVSYIQRMLRIGYMRAAHLVDLMIEERFCEDILQYEKPHRRIIRASYLPPEPHLHDDPSERYDCMYPHCRAKRLISTSVEDMQSGIVHFQSETDVIVIEIALQEAINAGYKSKAKVIQSRLKKLGSNYQPLISAF